MLYKYNLLFGITMNNGSFSIRDWLTGLVHPCKRRERFAPCCGQLTPFYVLGWIILDENVNFWVSLHILFCPWEVGFILTTSKTIIVWYRAVILCDFAILDHVPNCILFGVNFCQGLNIFKYI